MTSTEDTNLEEKMSAPAWKQKLFDNMKYVSLVFLVVQNATVILCMRYARTRDKEQFFAASAVVMSEIIKFLVCCGIVLVQVSGNFRAFLAYLNENIIQQPMDTLKLAVPSLVYTIQNNLLYVALSNLPAATYQVSYQLKILTTAMFMVAMLGKSLSRLQWLSMVMLFAGVAIVQVQTQTGKAPAESDSEQNPFIGLVAVIISCLSSGFAGVYFEKILKRSKGTIWLRNIQMSIFGVIAGFTGLYVSKWSEVIEKGVFYGFDALVWFIILIFALGGLLVAVVIKYADNILKGFATSISIVLSTVVSIIWMNFHLTWMFVTGASIVIIAVYLYSLPTAQPAPQTTQTQKKNW
ncbi:UDP-galactose translocator-like isoform X1 [Styela clava]